MSLSRRLLMGSSAVALVASLAACGGAAMPSSAGPTVTARVSAAAAPTEVQAQPPATAVAPTPTPALDLTTATFASYVSSAQAQVKTVACQFAMSVDGLGVEMTGKGSMQVAAGSPELAMTLTASGEGQMEERLVGGKLYVNAGAATGDKFLVLDPGDTSSGVSAQTDVDPAGNVKGLSSAIVSVTKVDVPIRLDGVLVQAYDVVVDTSEVTGQARRALDQAAAELQAAGVAMPTRITYRYWIGSDGLIREMSYTLAGLKTQMTFSHWGKPVDIEAPAASQITSTAKG